MATVSVSLPSDGQTIDAADYNTPINTIVTEINGSLDSNNIAEGGVVPNSLTDGTGTSWAWTTWEPTLGASGSMTFTSTTVNYAKYIQIGKTVHYKISATGTTGGTANASLTFTLPVTATNETSQSMGCGFATDGAAGEIVFAFAASTTLVNVRKQSSSSWGLGVSRAYFVTGTYEAA